MASSVDHQSSVISITPAIACLLSFGMLMTGPVLPAAASRAAAELVSASQATINGSSAISGMSVFSCNRVRTAQQGAAIVNLGKLGRLGLGAERDLTLRFQAGQLGGELHSGRLEVSAGAGVAISVSTATGLVTTNGRQAAMLTIEVSTGRWRVFAHQGESRVVWCDQAERVAALFLNISAVVSHIGAMSGRSSLEGRRRIHHKNTKSAEVSS